MKLKAVPKKVEQRLGRILDANFNRAKEGLRVCEDVCRFWYDDPAATRRYKDARHALTAALTPLGVMALLTARDIRGDVGRLSSDTELTRKSVQDIFYANSQRVKESIRVLEEFSKLLSPKTAEEIKRLRYRIYALEKDVALRL